MKHFLVVLMLVLSDVVSAADEATPPPVAQAPEQRDGLLYLEVVHDLGYFELSAQIRSIDDPERLHKISMMKGMHHNPISVPAGRYFFEAMIGPSQATFRPVTGPDSWFEVKADCLNYAGSWVVLLAPTQVQVKRGETLKRGYPLGPVDHLVNRKSELKGSRVCVAMVGQPAAVLDD